MTEEQDMKAGDIHPQFPDVIRMTIEDRRSATPSLERLCLGCPAFSAAVFGLGCFEYECGGGYVWFGEAVKVVNQINELRDQ